MRREHQWHFLLEPTSTGAPRTIVGVCEQCGLVRPHKIGREHTDPRIDVSGECQGRSLTGYLPRAIGVGLGLPDTFTAFNHAKNCALRHPVENQVHAPV